MSLKPSVREDIAFSSIEFSRRVLRYCEENYDGDSSQIALFRPAEGFVEWTTGIAFSWVPEIGECSVSMGGIRGTKLLKGPDVLLEVGNAHEQQDLIAKLFGTRLIPASDAEIVSELFLDMHDTPILPVIEPHAESFGVSLWIDDKSKFSLAVRKESDEKSYDWKISGEMPDILRPKGATRLARKDIDLKLLDEMLNLTVACFDQTTAADCRNQMAIFKTDSSI